MFNGSIYFVLYLQILCFYLVRQAAGVYNFLKVLVGGGGENAFFPHLVLPLYNTYNRVLQSQVDCRCVLVHHLKQIEPGAISVSCFGAQLI